MDTVQLAWELATVTTPHITIRWAEVDRWTVTKPVKTIERVMESSIQIGWDDKCGIVLAMQLYEKLWDKVSLLFTVWEETWWKWASHFVKENLDLLNKCTYAIVPDRRWQSDVLCNWSHWYGSKEFETDIMAILSNHWFSTAVGSICDWDTLKKYINCFNISCWYYEPHSSKDWISLDDLENTYNWLEDLITNYNKKLEPNKTEIKSYWKSYSRPYSRQDYPEDYDEKDDRDSIMGKWKQKKKIKTTGIFNVDWLFIINIEDWTLMVLKEINLYSYQASNQSKTLLPWKYWWYEI